MIYLMIGSIVCLCFGYLFVSRQDNELFGFVGGVLGTFGSVALIVVTACGYPYIAAGYEKDIINREFGTDYTQQQVFYASGVIDEIRELKRQRIELNGSLALPKGDY